MDHAHECHGENPGDLVFRPRSDDIMSLHLPHVGFSERYLHQTDPSSNATPPRTDPRTGKHVSFLDSEKTATAAGEKSDPKNNGTGGVIERDMVYETPAAVLPTNDADPDIILPSPPPGLNTNDSSNPAPSSAPRRS